MSETAKKPFVAVTGPMGVGKTSLVRSLCDKLQAIPLWEPVGTNPFLERFYQDRGRWAALCQLSFLAERVGQFSSLDPTKAYVSDHVLAQDRLFANLTLQGAELNLYERLRGKLTPLTVQPDVVILLTARLEVLLQRISYRGRSMEEEISPFYLSSLISGYETLMEMEKDLNWHVIDTSDMSEKELMKHVRALLNSEGISI